MARSPSGLPTSSIGWGSPKQYVANAPFRRTGRRRNAPLPRRSLEPAARLKARRLGCEATSQAHVGGPSLSHPLTGREAFERFEFCLNNRSPVVERRSLVSAIRVGCPPAAAVVRSSA